MDDHTTGDVCLSTDSELEGQSQSDGAVVVCEHGGRFPNVIRRMKDGTIHMTIDRSRDRFLITADEQLPPGQLCDTCHAIDFQGIT